MFKKLQKKIFYDDKLYNKIIFLSRNKLLYINFDLKDTFQNRINLIFFHISFIFIKIKHYKDKKLYKKFYQLMFDRIFICNNSFSNIYINFLCIKFLGISLLKL